MPVYLVKTPDGERMINAKNQVIAINHTIDSGVKYSAESLNTDQMSDKLAAGLKLETATEAAPGRKPE